MADFGNIGEAFVDIRANFGAFQKDLQGATQKLGRSLQGIGGGFSDVGSKLTLGLTLPLVAAAGAAVKFGSDFESGFAGVRKTVEGTEKQFADLEKGFRELAKSTGTSAVEILAIGEAAGQLGIETDNILEFTKVMADLGLTTNLSSQEAATALARLANITQLPQDQFSNLGSTIVALGNNLATTEAEIVQFGLRIAGAGSQVGLSEAEILSFGAALSSVGVQAQAGGTAISRTFIKISKAVSQGGAELDLFSKTAGLSVDEFSEKFRTDAAGATIEFIGGLTKISDAGGDVFKVLEDLGLADIRLSDALLRAAGAGDLFNKSLEIGNKAFEENTALSQEAAIRLATFERQFAKLGEQVKDVGVTLFATLRPIILDDILPLFQSFIQAIGFLAEKFNRLPGPIKKLVIGFLAFLAALGPILVVVGTIISALGSLVLVMGGLGASAGVAGAGVLTFSGVFAALTPILIGVASALAAVALVAVGIFAISELTNALFLWSQIADQMERVATEARTNVLGAFNALSEAAKAPEFKEFRDELERIFATFQETGDIEIFRAEIDRVGRGMKDLQTALATTVEVEKELEETTENLTAAQEGATQSTDDLKEAAKALAAQQKAANEATQNALQPFRSLNESFKLAKAGGATAAQFVAAYKDEIFAAGMTAEGSARLFDALGIEIGDLTPELQEAITALRMAQTQIDNTNISTLALASGIEFLGLAAGRDLPAGLSAAAVTTMLASERAQELQDAWDDLAKSSKDAEKEISDLEQEISDYNIVGATAEQVQAKFGQRIDEATKSSKLFGIQLGKETTAVRKDLKVKQENAKFAKNFQDSWNTAIGNVLGSFIQSIVDMDFSFKGFARTLIDTVKNLAKTIVGTFVGSLFKPVLALGQRFAENLSGTILAGITGQEGPAGGILGGLDFGGSFKGIGTQIKGAFAKALPFLTNPITLAIAGIGLAIFGAFKLFTKTPLEAGVKEVTRDFGVKVSEDTLKGFTEGLGLSEEQFKPIRKDILSSPQAFKDVLLPAAQATGSVDELVASFGRLEAFGQVFDLSSEAAQAAEGNFDALNQAFVDIFGDSAALTARFGEDLKGLLVETPESVADAVGGEPRTGELLGDIFVDRLDSLIEVMGVGFESLTEKLTEIVDRLTALIEGPAGMEVLGTPGGPGSTITLNIDALDAASFRDFLAGEGGDALINELFLRRQAEMIEVVSTGAKGTQE